MDLATFANLWLRRERVRLKPRTVETYEAALQQHILPMLGKTTGISALKREVIRDALLSKLEDGYAVSTVKLWLAVTRALLNGALDDGLIPANPTARIGRLLPKRKGPQGQRALTHGELDRLLAALAQHPLRPFFVLAAKTGMRLGELLGLRWTDIDFEHRTVTVRCSVDWRNREGVPKGGECATLPLSRLAYEALDALRQRNGARDGEWIFHGPSGRPLSRTSVKFAMTLACARAGIPHASPHALRHTFCTHLAQEGASAWEVQELARHASVVTSQGYVHLNGRHVALVNRLDRD